MNASVVGGREHSSGGVEEAFPVFDVHAFCRVSDINLVKLCP